MAELSDKEVFGSGKEMTDAEVFSTPQEKPQRGLLDKLLGTTGPRYQTFPERAVREVLSLPQRTIEAAASTLPGTREATEAMIGPAAETAMLTTGGMGKGLIARPLKQVAQVPTQEELLSVYGPLKQSGELDVKLTTDAVTDLRTNIHDALKEEHFREYLAPQVYRAIQELDEVPNPTVMDVEGVRRLLGNVNPSEYKAANIARDKINEYLGEVQPADVIGGANVGEVLTKVRGNYAAGKRSQIITEAQEKGERAAQSSGSGANLDNAIRQQLKRIRNSPRLMRGVSAEETAAIDKAIKGGSLSNLARLASKLGPKHPISGWLPAILADLKGGLGTATGSLALGAGAQKLAEVIRLREMARLDELMRKRSPMFKEAQATNPPVAKKPLRITIPYSGGVGSLINKLGDQNASQ